MINQEVIDFWENLTEAKKEFLFNNIVAEKKVDIQAVSSELNVETGVDPVSCPYCKSVLVVKYGSFNNKIRYRCNQCRKLFNRSEVYRLKKADKLYEYVEMLVSSVSIREAARLLDVQAVTIIKWRKKILSAFEHLKTTTEKPE